MPITVDSSAAYQMAQPALGVHWLIEADFTTGTQYITTAPVNITVSGHTYIGVGQLVNISNVTENDKVSTEKLTLSMSLANDSNVAIVAGDVNVYRGKVIRLYLQVLDSNFAPVGARILRWKGYMSPVSIKPQSDDEGNQTGRVEMPLVRAGLAKFRHFNGMRLTHVQQIRRYPGDLGMQYLNELIEKPAIWLTRAFQFQK